MRASPASRTGAMRKAVGKHGAQPTTLRGGSAKDQGVAAPVPSFRHGCRSVTRGWHGNSAALGHTIRPPWHLAASLGNPGASRKGLCASKTASRARQGGLRARLRHSRASLFCLARKPAGVGAQGFPGCARASPGSRAKLSALHASLFALRARPRGLATGIPRLARKQESFAKRNAGRSRGARSARAAAPARLDQPSLLACPVSRSTV